MCAALFVLYISRVCSYLTDKAQTSQMMSYTYIAHSSERPCNLYLDTRALKMNI